jgi:hypothetical protein
MNNVRATSFVAAADGTYSVVFSETVGSDGILEQTLTTTPGTSYTISFYLNTGGQTPNELILSLGGTQVAAVENVSTSGFAEYTYTETASGSSSVLEFQGGNNPAASLLDNIVVAPAASATPEPATWALLAGGLALAPGLRRKLRS